MRTQQPALFLTVALMLATGNSLAEPVARGRAANNAEIAVLRESLQEKLKDADSAKFKEVYFGTGENAETVCGLINAKNSYGAYAGFNVFIGMVFPGTKKSGGKLMAYVVGVDSSDSPIAAKMCADKGIM